MKEFKSVFNVSKGDIIEYNNEFVDNGEECALLWRMNEVGIDNWLAEIREDTHTTYVCFLIDGKLIGIGRLTPHPNYPANGQLGYGIRPKERRKMHGTEFVKCLIELASLIGMKSITACVDVNNIASRNLLTKCGFVDTKVVYDWFGGRKANEFILLRKEG